MRDVSLCGMVGWGKTGSWELGLEVQRQEGKIWLSGRDPMHGISGYGEHKSFQKRNLALHVYTAGPAQAGDLRSRP